MQIHNPILTGSFSVNGADLSTITGSVATSASFDARTTYLESTSSILTAASASQSVTSGSLVAASASLSATSGSLSAASGSFNTRVSALEVTGSALSSSLLTVSGSGYATSGSLNTRVTALEVTGSALSSSLLTVSGSGYATSASLSTASGSFDTRVATIESKYATTGSNTFTSTQVVSGSILQSGSFTTTGTIIAQTINVQTVTSSIVYSSGSNVFGNSIGNSQVFTGSVLITGSLTIAGASSATSYNGATIFGSTIACSPIGCFATSCATSFIGGTMSGTTIYGSTAVCSPVGLFSGCIGIGASINPAYMLEVSSTGGSQRIRVGTLQNNDNTPRFEAITSNGNLVANSAWLKVNDAGGFTLGQSDYTKAGCDSGNFACLSSETEYPRITIASTGAATFSSSVTATSITVATDCSGVIVDVAGRHGLMKYYNYGTGLIGCCTGTDGGISIWLGRFAGSITAPTGVYQDLKIFNSGIACFACQVCAPTFKGGTINGTIGSFSCHVELNDNGLGWIYGNDKNHSIIMRGDRNGCAADYTNYYQYGGNLLTCKGHNFWTDGLLANQTIKMQIANNGICMTVPLYVCNIANSRSFQTLTGAVTIGAYGTCTLLYLSTSIAGTYIINASFGAQGLDIYGGMLIVVANGGSFRVVTNGSGTRSAITLSGCAVQLTNALGVTLDSNAHALYIGAL